MQNLWASVQEWFTRAAAPVTEEQQPPWPNGQGVGLLIGRLRVRVPQGVSFSQRGLLCGDCPPQALCVCASKRFVRLLSAGHPVGTTRKS